MWPVESVVAKKKWPSFSWRQRAAAMGCEARLAVGLSQIRIAGWRGGTLHRRPRYAVPSRRFHRAVTSVTSEAVTSEASLCNYIEAVTPRGYIGYIGGGYIGGLALRAARPVEKLQDPRHRAVVRAAVDPARGIRRRSGWRSGWQGDGRGGSSGAAAAAAADASLRGRPLRSLPAPASRLARPHRLRLNEASATKKSIRTSSISAPITQRAAILRELSITQSVVNQSISRQSINQSPSGPQALRAAAA